MMMKVKPPGVVELEHVWVEGDTASLAARIAPPADECIGEPDNFFIKEDRSPCLARDECASQ